MATMDDALRALARSRRRLRLDILAELYRAPARRGLYRRELAERLGCAPQDADFALWVLEEDGWVRTDRVRVRITARGARALEEMVDD